MLELLVRILGNLLPLRNEVCDLPKKINFFLAPKWGPSTVDPATIPTATPAQRA